MSAGLPAWVELGRLSNLPTCLTNVLVGVALATGPEDSPYWPKAILVFLSVTGFYFAGMALNDVVDAEVDKIERPGRPIPSGRILRSSALGFAAVVLLFATVLLLPLGWRTTLFGAGLALCIVAYDLLHKRLAASALLMGFCRGLVYLIAASAFSWSLELRPTAWAVGLIVTYIVAVTLIARAESGPTIAGWSKLLGLGLPLIAVAPAMGLATPNPAWTLALGAVFVGWLLFAATNLFARPPRTIRAVLSLLAGICLLDAYLLTWLGRPAWSMVAVACFALTVHAHRRVLGT